jgi:hypothetical protein
MHHVAGAVGVPEHLDEDCGEVPDGLRQGVTTAKLRGGLPSGREEAGEGPRVHVGLERSDREQEARTECGRRWWLATGKPEDGRVEPLGELCGIGGGDLALSGSVEVEHSPPVLPRGRARQREVGGSGTPLVGLGHCAELLGIEWKVHDPVSPELQQRGVAGGAVEVARGDQGIEHRDRAECWDAERAGQPAEREVVAEDWDALLLGELERRKPAPAVLAVHLGEVF